MIHSSEINNPKSTIEIVHPSVLPGMAFQSYEMLKNDAPKQKKAFLAGEVRNPELTYTNLESDSMNQGIAELQEAIESVRGVESDTEKADIIATTLEFRIAEMEYIKLLAELNAAVDTNWPEEDVRELADRVRELNEQLYGAPDERIRDAAYGEVWAQLNSKPLSASAQELFDELKGMLPQPENPEKMPDLNHPSVTWAGEIVLRDNSDVEAYFRSFWDQQVEEHGEGWVADPAAIVEAYRGAFAVMDPTNESGVGVVMDPDATAMSWESSLMSIKVGEKRVVPVKSAEKLFKLFLHEGVLHGGRAISGLKTGLPILGTGLYTDTERADYLKYEEGLAKIIEAAVGETETKWSGSNMGHYINISLAYGGADFRDVYETAWRYRVLMKLKPNQDIDMEMVEEQKNQAYNAAVRIFRGMPINIKEKYPSIVPITYNKDLAYMEGVWIASQDVQRLYDARDEDGFRKRFEAKYDPTIPEQAAIVEKYSGKEG